MSGARDRQGALVAPLARAEGWQLLSHPVVLVGIAIASLGCAVAVRAIVAGSAVSWGEDGWTAVVGVLLLGILTMVATNLAALRDRRAHTTEQHDALPLRAAPRTSGLLAAITWPAGVATVLLAVAAIVGVVKDLPPGRIELIQFAQCVAWVGLLGATGVALARWAPNPFVAPVVAWFVMFVNPSDPTAAWQSLIPWQTMSTTGLAAWHLVYVCGLTATVAVVALARAGRTRALQAAAILAVAIMVVSAVALTQGACPPGSLCRF